ncbi:MAG: hypothetical protein ACI9O0_000061 [Paracoccaceae bacterium]|jgi:hypothetical protein
MGWVFLMRIAIFAVACLGLAACQYTPRTELKPMPLPKLFANAQSRAMQNYYAEVQGALLQHGLLRTDRGVENAPYDAQDLARNFTRIALFDEYHQGFSGMVQRETTSRLRRWVAPVLVQLHFGPSVALDKRAIDRARVKTYVSQLATITGHSISMTKTGGNFDIYVVSEEERRNLAAIITKTLPHLALSDVRGITNMQRSTYCLVYALSEGQSSIYNRAFAVVRAEHPDLMRQACFHEEIAQGLGLANDSPEARPSIFNDDEEFALLTLQDEQMLKMLYDRRLKIGMAAAEAGPTITLLAQELIPVGL